MSAHDPTSGAYLADLRGRLVVRGRRREEILEELADGLECTVNRYREVGLSASEAEAAAVREFGSPAVVAAAVNEQHAGVAARRIGLGLIITGPLVGLAWVAALAGTGPDLPARVSEALSSVPVYPALLAISVPACVVAFATRGLVPYRREGGRRPGREREAAALVAVLMCALGDLYLIANLVLAGGSAAAVWSAVAVAASLIRLSGVSLAGRRLLRLRRA